jgi:hypothetical protein
MKFVPHTVHDDEKLRKNACKDFVGTADDEPGFLNTIIIGCESLHFQYDHEIQRVQNSKSHISQRPKEGSLPQILHKKMLIILQFQWDNP